jgi:hypothetical protein
MLVLPSETHFLSFLGELSNALRSVLALPLHLRVFSRDLFPLLVDRLSPLVFRGFALS